MAHQYDYIIPQSAGTGFGGMSRWSLWRFSTVEKTKRHFIVAHIEDNNLSVRDLAGPEFKIFVDNEALLGEDTVDCVRFFTGLLDLKWTGLNFFCLYDNRMWYNAHPSIPIFKAIEKEILFELGNQYCSDVVPWKDMTDKEIES